jgi:hypothetical protein
MPRWHERGRGDKDEALSFHIGGCGVPVLVCVAATLAFALATAAPSFATSGATSWGDNEQGQLGNGSTTSSDLPGAVTGLGDGVSAISAGSTHSLALMTSGAVAAWGANGSGQLGNERLRARKRALPDSARLPAPRPPEPWVD